MGLVQQKVLSHLTKC